jgi:1-acyl-sn-glycerol-3-phosphate acyltransferase
MGTQSAFFGPAKFSILPQHLKEEDIVGGNALIEAGTFLSILLGTILGGVLITLDKGPLIVSIPLLVVAVLGYVTSLKIPQAPASESQLKIQWNPLVTTWDVLRFSTEKRVVFLSILGCSWFWFAGAILLSIFPPLSHDVLRSNESMITLFLSVFSVGIGIGSILCEKLSYKRVELGLVPFGSMGISFFCLLLYFQFAGTSLIGLTVLEFCTSLKGMLILLNLFGLSVMSGMFIVPLNALVQERSNPVFRSRIISANNIMNALFMVIASVLLLFLLKWGVRIATVFLILAIMNGVVAVYIYLLVPEFLFRFLAWILARFIYRVRISGEEHIPLDGPAICICNHVSFADWLILFASVRRPMSFVMDHSFFKGFLLKKIMTQAKVIPIASAKESEALYQSAFKRMEDILADGGVICIFPEGKITYDGKLNEFRPGILKMLKTSPVPVVPMALSGLWGSFFSRYERNLLKKRPRSIRSKIHVDIAPAIAPEDVTLEKLFKSVSDLRRSP